MADERAVPGKTAVQNVQKHIARYNLALEFCGGKKILDAACGSGYGTEMISWVADSVVGIDIDEQTIKHANQMHSTENNKFYSQDVMEMQGEYDGVVSFETLEHVEDVDKLIQQMRSVVRPGGFILYSLPLNEAPGFNEHHKHTYDLESARSLFGGELKAELIQRGVNFFGPDTYKSDEGFVYYLGFCLI